MFEINNSPIKKIGILIAYSLIIFYVVYFLPAESHKYFFIIYSLGIFLILLNASKSNKNQSDQKAQKIFFIILLIISIVFLMATRLLPFIRFGEAPLGYDTGFYLWRSGASNAVEKPFYLSYLPYFFLGMTPLTSLNVFYVTSQFLLAGSLYVLLRTLKVALNFPLAVIGIFLFSASITQFQSFWWMFCQQTLSMCFLLITLSLIFRRSWFAVLTAALGAIIHPPTFIILIFVISVYFIFFLWKSYKEKGKINAKLIYLIGCGLGMAAILIIFKFQEFKTYFDLYILTYHGLSTNFPFWEIPKMKGLFVSPLFYNLSTLLIVPFAAYSFLNPSIWRDGLTPSKNGHSIRPFLFLLYTIFIGLFILISFPVIYQHRFIIIFDIFLIIFAAPAMLILTKHFLHDKVGKVLITIFIIFLFTKNGLYVLAQQPQLQPEELTEIKAMSMLNDSKAVLIATNSTYTPWVIGFSGKDSFGPGYGGDLWSLYDWIKFWQSTDNNERYKLLAKYPNNSIYLFIGNKENVNAAYQKHIKNSSDFTSISPHIWKYTPWQIEYDSK